MKIADLCIRVSTDEQAERGYSQRDQEERLRKYCLIKNIEVRWVYIEDHSAKTFNRPQWQIYLSKLKKIKNSKTAVQVISLNGTDSAETLEMHIK
jgi:site-specific DNA recombinase